MADIEVVKGEFGDVYDITIYDEESEGIMDISGFDTITLTGKTSDFASTILGPITLSKPAGTEGIARWTILSAHTASLTPGSGIAQIDMVDGAVSIRRKTLHMSLDILENLS